MSFFYQFGFLKNLNVYIAFIKHKLIKKQNKAKMKRRKKDTQMYPVGTDKQLGWYYKCSLAKKKICISHSQDTE